MQRSGDEKTVGMWLQGTEERLAVWDMERGGESDGDGTAEGGRCYILLELC